MSADPRPEARTDRLRAAGAALVLVGCLAVACGGSARQKVGSSPEISGASAELPALPPSAASPQPASATAPAAALASSAGNPQAPAPLARRQVRLFFPAEDREGLWPEVHEIFDTASPVDRAKQILSDLISGPNEEGLLPVLPRNARLRQVFVLDDGVAWVDFSEDLRTSLPGGSEQELLAVYAIVNGLALNVPEIERVGILLGGRPCTTLNGHLDLRLPLPPRLDLLATPAEEPAVP